MNKDGEKHHGPVAILKSLSHHYGKTRALDKIDLSLPSACTVGLIGPDGVGKSSLMSLISGAMAVQEGGLAVLGGDMRLKKYRNELCPKIAYMPQGLGKNLYHTLSVEENLQFFARLFGHNAAERRRRIDDLTKSTGLFPFLDRPAGKLSGGMKQKLGLCCSMIHDPDLVVLDEPTTGVDPLARAQFWSLIDRIKRERPDMSVLVATAYMDEAQRFDWLVAMDEGKVLAQDTPQGILEKTGSKSLEEAFIKLLPEEKRQTHSVLEIPPLEEDGAGKEIAIEAQGLTKKFGNFVAVDHVSFKIRRGEIFGFLGSNGCGKSTTMKMLTGLLPATEGKAWLFGHEVDPEDLSTRKRVGYMSQAFSLYSELSVRQNLVLHARLFHVPKELIEERVNEMLKQFDLQDVPGALPGNLPLGVRQRLSLAVAMVHKPDMLILDEPTSGVDPVARDSFWRMMIELARRDKVTIFISTHFMNEAERCDRISLMHSGRVLAVGSPAELVEEAGALTLEDTFIGYLKQAGADKDIPSEEEIKTHGRSSADEAKQKKKRANPYFSVQRMISYLWRENLELKRDPVRATLALAGSLILMLVIGFGITMDVDNLSYAVLDRDQSGISRDYALNIAGSRYFVEKAPILDYADLDRRMRNGELSLAIEIPPGFAKDVQRGRQAQVGAWLDGAMPMRAETIKGYVEGMHQGWLMRNAVAVYGDAAKPPAGIEVRFRYNPDVKSTPAMVPAVMAILLLMLPSLLAALSVVREKELGSILNLYTTPVTKAEFILGKQFPYVLLAFANFLLMTLMAAVVFNVPVKGSFVALALGAFLYVFIATAIGMLASTFTRSQIAAIFITVIVTVVPAIQFSGMLNPISSLEGAGRFVGGIFPTTHMLIISRGTFNKALMMGDLASPLLALALTGPLVIVLSIVLLKKQEV